MTTVDEFLAAARSELNYLETPINLTKFAAEAGHLNGYAWCATFLVAIANRTGLALPSGCYSAYTPSMVNGWKAASLFVNGTSGIERGDFVYYDFPDATTGVEHVGVVTSVAFDGITAIEGNTSSGIDGSQDNGGGVFERQRNYSYIVGYGIPSYTAPIPKPIPTPEEKNMQFVANVPWQASNSNGTDPFWIVIPGDTDKEFLVASVNNAPFTPAWKNGQELKSASGVVWGKDFSYLGLWYRRFTNTTGKFYGPPMVYSDRVVVACEGGGTYRIASK